MAREEDLAREGLREREEEVDVENFCVVFPCKRARVSERTAGLRVLGSMGRGGGEVTQPGVWHDGGRGGGGERCTAGRVIQQA